MTVKMELDATAGNLSAAGSEKAEALNQGQPPNPKEETLGNV